MATITVNGKSYVQTDEPANVMGRDFRELATVVADNGQRGLLYQHAGDQRLAFAAGSILATGPMAIYLKKVPA